MDEATLKLIEALADRMKRFEDELARLKAAKSAPQLPAPTGSTPIYADLYAQTGYDKEGKPILAPVEIDANGVIQTSFQ